MNKAQLMQKRHQITLDNLYLGRYIAKKYAGTLDLDTLFSIADLELFECTETFDANYGGKKRSLGTYAGRPIKSEIRREIVRQRLIGMTDLPKELSDRYIKIKNAEISLWYELKRHPKDEEVLDYLHTQARLRKAECVITPRHIQAYRMMANGRVALSSVYERQNADRYNPLERMAQNERNESLKKIVYNGVLDVRERKIVIWHFGFENEELTLEEIGERLKITKERVRQIEEKALEKIERAIKKPR